MSPEVTSPCDHDMSATVEGRPDLAPVRRSSIGYGLMSLSAMINGRLSGLVALCKELELQACSTIRFDGFDEFDPDLPVDESAKRRWRRWLDTAEDIADALELDSFRERIEFFRRKLQRSLTFRTASHEASGLLHALDKGVSRQLIYRYPSDKAAYLQQWQSAWAPALAAFPVARDDIMAAVDCWALGHATASMFHAMRAVEHGLCALATDLGISFDVESWQVVLDKMGSKVIELGKSLPRGEAKSKRLEFLSQALKETSFFKDGWRNHVMHGRTVYDEHQARSVLEHVRAFMNAIADELANELPE